MFELWRPCFYIDEGGDGPSTGGGSGGGSPSGSYYKPSLPPYYEPPPQVYLPPQSVDYPSIGWTGTALDAFVSQVPSVLYGNVTTKAMTTVAVTYGLWTELYTDGIVLPDSTFGIFSVPPALSDHAIVVSGNLVFTANSSQRAQVWLQETLYDATTRSIQIGGAFGNSSGIVGANFTGIVFVGHGTTAVQSLQIQARTNALTAPSTITGGRLIFYEVR